MRTIEHAKENWNKDYICSLSEEDFVTKFCHKINHNSLRKLWKLANGLTKPNYEVKESKPKRRRSTKK